MVNTYVNRKLSLVKGDGVFLFDENGKKYLDFMSNYGVNIFGYNHPTITKTLSNQIKRLPSLHGSFNNDVRAIASEALIKKCGEEFYSQVYWSNSGSEAIEAALKFAVLATSKRKFIVSEHGYHGKTLGALSATSGEKYKQPFEPLLWKFVQVPFNNTKELEKAIDKNTAAFIVEPIQGESGILVPQKDYLSKVKKICEKKGVLLIIDEIQTGVGRTGYFLASQGDNVFADILCLGKGLAGCIPVGATIINKRVRSSIYKHIHTSTFGGNPLACAGVLVTLSLLDKAQLDHNIKTGQYFLEKLSSLKSNLINEVRGLGLMIGLDVKDKRNEILKMLQDESILAIPAGDSVVRFLPPYIVTKKHIDTVIESLRRILEKIS